MLVANLAQPLEIAPRWNVPACAASDRLHNDRRHIAGVVQGQNTVFKICQRVHLPHWLYVVYKGMVHRVVDKRHVVYTRQQSAAKCLAVAGYASNADPAKAHTVVAPFTPNEHAAMAFSACAVVGQRHLQRRVSRFRA